MNVDPAAAMVTIGSGIAAVVLGYLKRAGKLTIAFGNGKSCPILMSKRTGGALRISEEGLARLSALSEDIQEHYVTHDQCGKSVSDMRLAFRNDLDETRDKIREEISALAKQVREDSNQLRTETVSAISGVNAALADLASRLGK